MKINTNSLRLILICFLFIQSCYFFPIEKLKVDILIIGGGASGVSAGIQSSRMGCKALIIESSTWLGGMLTSAGVSAIDGNHNLPAGIWGEFRDSLITHYGHADSLKTGWVSNVLFEPSVGNQIFKRIAEKEKNLNVWYKSELSSLKKTKSKVWNAIIRSENIKKEVEAKIIIDATELGDVAKLCGVKYDIGMDSSAETKEEIAPSKANNIIQDLTYVAILKDYGKNVSIERPAGYDSTLFACTCINELCITPKESNRLWACDQMITYGKLPNNKYMINWPIEGNDYYTNIIELNTEERNKELEKAKHFTMCFIYFLQKELGFNTLGLADDEFPTEDKLPFIPYHRESRRIHGKVHFTLNHITAPYTQSEKLYRTTIAVGDYPVDHHHARYHGYENLPDLYFHPIPSYGLPLGTLISEDTEGLIVAEKSISVSNLVNGTTRLQPVVLQIGQVSGILAALAIKEKKEIKNVSVRDVQKAVLSHKGYLLPYLDVDVNHPLFKTYQRIGATGILRGEGKTIGWSNQTWLRCDTLLLSSELNGLKEVYPATRLDNISPIVTAKDALSLIVQISDNEQIKHKENITDLSKKIFLKYQLGEFNYDSPIKRGEFAALIDELLNPFGKEIDIKGNYLDL